MSAQPQAAELQWIKPDDYHIRTTCGRYSVSRVTTADHLHYIAWRLGTDDQPSTELTFTTVKRDATDDERKAAIKRVQQACSQHHAEARNV